LGNILCPKWEVKGLTSIEYVFEDVDKKWIEMVNNEVYIPMPEGLWTMCLIWTQSGID
jgi:hypothetical protein